MRPPVSPSPMIIYTLCKVRAVCDGDQRGAGEASQATRLREAANQLSQMNPLGDVGRDCKQKCMPRSIRVREEDQKLVVCGVSYQLDFVLLFVMQRTHCTKWHTAETRAQVHWQIASRDWLWFFCGYRAFMSATALRYSCSYCEDR